MKEQGNEAYLARRIEFGPRFDTLMQNKLGEWVPAIPLPFFGFRRKCRCGAKFWTLEGYRGHYALAHILDPPGE